MFSRESGLLCNGTAWVICFLAREKQMLKRPSLRLCVFAFNFFNIQWFILPDPAACDLTYL
jgi:hypothetical protein